MDIETEIIEFEIGKDTTGRKIKKKTEKPKRNVHTEARRFHRVLIALILILAVACVLLFISPLVFSFNFEYSTAYEHQIPFFHPRYLEAFLNWAFNLHLSIQTYLPGQRFYNTYYYVEQFWGIGTMLLAAGGLAAAGASYQAVFNNPLASPDLLGVSAGTETGSIIAFVWLGFGYYGSFTFGLLIGVFTIILIFVFSNLVDKGRPRIITLLLCGVALTQFYNAVMTLILSGVLVLDPADSDSSSYFDKIQVFTQSHFDRHTPFLYVSVLAGIALLILMSWRLNALAFGDEEARGMGINPRVTRNVTLWTATILTVAIVSQCGPLSFVGLIAPHIARRLVGQNYRRVIPASILVGCVFVAVARVAFQFFGGSDINSITTLVGVPYFIKILLGMRRRQHLRVSS